MLEIAISKKLDDFTLNSNFTSDNGKTLFDSKTNINIPPRKRNIGYVFQNYAFFPHLYDYPHLSECKCKSQFMKLLLGTILMISAIKLFFKRK